MTECVHFRMVYSKFEGSDVKIQTSEAEYPYITIGEYLFFAIPLTTTGETKAVHLFVSSYDLVKKTLSERPLTSHIQSCKIKVSSNQIRDSMLAIVLNG